MNRWSIALTFVAAWALACAVRRLFFLPSRRRAALQAAARGAAPPKAPAPPAVE